MHEIIGAFSNGSKGHSQNDDAFSLSEKYQLGLILIFMVEGLKNSCDNLQKTAYICVGTT